jgi:hypothetical protein
MSHDDMMTYKTRGHKEPSTLRLMRDPREKRDLHALDADGMVLCNPRDREAAHRAEVEGIATSALEAVTCKKCIALLPRGRRTL